MKKLVLLILAVALLLLSACGSTPKTDLQTLAAANTVSAVAESGTANFQHCEQYNPEDGSLIRQWNGYVRPAEDGATSYAFCYDENYWIILSGDKSCGYAPNIESVFAMCFVGDAYNDMINDLNSQNIGFFADGQETVSEKVAGDGHLLITVEGAAAASDDESLQGKRFRYKYEVEPDTLSIVKIDSYLLGEDGSEALCYHGEGETNAQFEIPDYYSQIESASARREVCITADPGTQAERENRFSVPEAMPMAVCLPKGYALYEDAACTALAAESMYDFLYGATYYAAPTAQQGE